MGFIELEWLGYYLLISRVSLVSAILTFLALLGGLLGYLYGPYWALRKVPGPSPMPLVGHLPLLAKYGPDVFSVLAKQYGPIYRFHMGRQPLILVADAELCKEVGIKKFKDIPNRSIPSPISASPLHQKGLFFTRGSRWSIMRNTILSVYQPSHLASLVPMMQSYIESATQNLETSKEDIIFSDFSLRLATDVIGEAAFGVNFCLSNTQSVSNSDPHQPLKQFVLSSQNLNHSSRTISFQVQGSMYGRDYTQNSYCVKDDPNSSNCESINRVNASASDVSCCLSMSHSNCNLDPHRPLQHSILSSRDPNHASHSLSLLQSMNDRDHTRDGFHVGEDLDSSICESIKSVDANDEVSDFINQHIYSTTQLKMDLSGSLSIILGLLAPILQEPFRQILKRIPGAMDYKIERSNKKLSGILDEIVKKRMEERNRTSKNFLSLILNAMESKAVSENVFSHDYISAVTYEHLLAGSATTSFTLSSIVYLVARHKEVEEKLIQEIDGFGPIDKIPNAQELNDCFPYLDQVIKEAMRFYTVSPLVARETLNEVEIGGYLLPKGTWVWLALGVLAKDPRNFPEPEKFKPERFDPKCEEMKRRHPYAFLPFGIGPRACIGQKFSLQEIKLTLIHLYRKYVFCYDMEKPLELEYGIVLNFKHDLKLRVINRT